LAARLEIAYLDTGAMYRAIALSALNRGIDLSDNRALWETSRAAELELDCGPTHTRVRLNGHDVSEAIRTLAVSAATSAVAKQPQIRALLVERQRAIGRRLGSFVTEGRDQGSVVFPDAEVKIVLDATLEARAERRFHEMASEGEKVVLADVIQNLRDRDWVDSKQWEPLLAKGMATVIDTTHLSISEVVDRMLEIVHSDRGSGVKG
jgi:cytidylate kinase